MRRAASASTRVSPGAIDTPMAADMLEGQAVAMPEIMKQQPLRLPQCKATE
jgi:hypothetical protein